MTDRPWLSSYSPGVPAEIDPSQYASLVALLEEAVTQSASRTAYSCMGKARSYAQTEPQSAALALYRERLGRSQG